MARQTQTIIESAIAVDPPLVQNSEYKFDPADRRYIDSQIRGCQQHLVDSVLSGSVCTWQEVDSTSAALIVGDAVVPTASGKVSKATAALLAAAGSAYGIAVTTGVPGGKVRLAIGGRVPRTVTGLAAAAAGFAVINTTTARLEKVAAYAGTDWPAGIIDAEGTLAVTLPLSQGGAVAGTSVAAGFSNELYVDIAGNNTTAVRGSAARPYRTLTAALAAAQSGDVVRMGPGTWAEVVLLPELADISIIGAGMDHTWIEGVATGQDGTLGAYPSTTTIEKLLIADLTVRNAGGFGIGLAIDISGASLATPGIGREYPIILQNVRCITQNGEGSQIQCAGRALITGCELDGLKLQTVARPRVIGSILPDTGSVLTVAWDAAGILPTDWLDCEARVTGSSLCGVTATGQALVIAAGCDLGSVTISSTDAGGAQGSLTASACKLASVVASGTAVVAGDIVTLDACKVASMTVTKTGAAGTRVKASARGGYVGAVSAGASCDLDIRGSAFVQASLAVVGDGTIERSRHREAVHLLPTGDGGPVDVTFAVPFTTNAYSVAFSVQRPGIDPRVTVTSTTGIRTECTLEDEDASFILIHD